MYFGERRTGCRFYEFIFKNYRCLYLENDVIRTVIMLDKGTDIISFVDKKSDTEFVWTNPMGISCLDKINFAKMDNNCISDNYPGGWFEILPNVGNECTILNKHFPKHGEISYLPWDYSIIEDSADKIKLLFITRLSKYPFEVRKHLTVKRNSPTLYFDEEFINLGYISVPYLWGFHPNIGKPFLDENCVFELPFTKEHFEMPAEGSHKNGLWYFENVETPYGCVYNKNTGIGIEVEWDNRLMKHCWLWINSGYDCGHHHCDGTYVCCILPTSAKNSAGLEILSNEGSALILNPQQVEKHSYKIGTASKKIL